MPCTVADITLTAGLLNSHKKSASLLKKGKTTIESQKEGK